MNFIVYFYNDDTIVLLPQLDVTFQKDMTLNEWSSVQGRVEAKCVYDNDIFDACVLMVVPDEDDGCEELIKKLRLAKRKLTLDNLIKFCPGRVKRGRTRVRPVSQITTDEEEISDRHHSPIKTPQRSAPPKIVLPCVKRPATPTFSASPLTVETATPTSRCANSPTVFGETSSHSGTSSLPLDSESASLRFIVKKLSSLASAVNLEPDSGAGNFLILFIAVRLHFS